MPGHQGENLYKIGPNKFMGGGGMCGRGEKGGAFCFGMHFSQSKNACLLNLIKPVLLVSKTILVIY